MEGWLLVPSLDVGDGRPGQVGTLSQRLLRQPR